MTVVVKVENVSKKYQLGKIGAQSFQGEFQRWWSKVRGKEDPFTKIGVQSQMENSEFWALRDINFEVQQGDAVGIIGKNGAGKSTLLKILSRITLPTTGSVKVKGRIASLLEVGTGFNPELTGRENIFLNGAILGMSKTEVKAKFDEIVDFSGIAKFIDTPVKRYSSGMYVRLAFAVAAHLESEILILDEVLAVGDAEFQKKCLGKMDDVAHKQGRTILFVSHSMTAIKSLCSHGILLQHGNIVSQGNINNVADKYMNLDKDDQLIQDWPSVEDAPGNEYVRLKHISIQASAEFAHVNFTPETPLQVKFEFWNFIDGALLNLSMHVLNLGGLTIFASPSPRIRFNKGLVSFTCNIPAYLLNDGKYSINVMIIRNFSALFILEKGIVFEIQEIKRDGAWFGKWPGVIRPKLEWYYENKEEYNIL